MNGYRLMQPASGMFLGWTKNAFGRHFFLRHLRDGKIVAQSFAGKITPKG